MLALVAARRQKEIKRGIDTYAKHVCRRRRDGSQYFPLFVLFVLFGQAKRTLKEKKHKESFFLIVLFSDEKYQKSAKRVFPSLCELTPRARACRASHAWRVRAARGKAQVGGFAALRNLILPRVRTYHTRKPSRFCTHCLHARIIGLAGVGRGCALTGLSK